MFIFLILNISLFYCFAHPCVTALLEALGSSQGAAFQRQNFGNVRATQGSFQYGEIDF